MEYISIDIETTGLDRENDQVLEIGAIIENTLNPLPYEELPKFHAIIKHDRYSGSAFALHMNQRIFKIHADRILLKDEDEKIRYDDYHNIVKADSVAYEFYYWCSLHLTENKPKDSQTPVKVTVAGKNFAGFDNPFLSRLPEWNKYFRFHHRTLDPAPLFWNIMEDKTLPDLIKCMDRAGIEDPVVTHDAVQDAWDVIRVLRTKYEMYD